MDHMSSPAAVSTSSVIAHSLVSKQPTYTTAGTLYNPSTSQPLQPPTRRGRSLKWATGGASSGLALFPKSILASLPLGASSGQNSSIQQYTPLQQNYDRAVNPSHEPAACDTNMSAQVPRMRSGNAPASLSYLFSDTDQNKYPADGGASDEEEDSDFGTDPLSNMTVKSLQNLASYPNPNQKRAQKALLRGTKPTLNGISAVARNSASPTPSNRPYGYPEKTTQRTPSPFMLRSANSDSLAVRQAQTETRANSDQGRPAVIEPDNAHNQPAAVNGQAVSSASASMTLASGPGAPQPLTAGPPGQRQYRPSTFESTFKALQPKSKADQNIGNNDEEDEGFAIARQTLLNAGIEDMNLMLASSSSPFDQSTGQHLAAVEQTKSVGAHLGDSFSPFAPIGAHLYDRQKPPSIWAYRTETSQSSWSITPLTSGFQQGPRPFRLSEDQLKARNETIDRAWYAGSDFLERTTADSDDGCSQKFENKFGAIGEGRPRKNKEQNRPIDIAEANRLSVAEHARPLVNMAYASLLRHVEEKSCKNEPWSLEKAAAVWTGEEMATEGKMFLGKAAGEA